MNEFLRKFLFLPHQQSTFARPLDGLHYFVILTTMAGAALVTLAGGYFVIRYRRRLGEQSTANPYAAARPHFLWKISALVGLIVLFLVWWAIGVRQYVIMRTAPLQTVDIYVTAKKWMWKFGYPTGARSIARLYIPVNKPVKLIMTSRDVIHSFYVPEFRVKQDVVPGRYTTMWFQAVATGRYPVFCAEYCGTGHSMMRAEVVVLSAEDYDRWLAGEEPPRLAPSGPRYEEPQLGLTDAAPVEPLSLVRQGERVAAESGCLRCHTLDGSPHLGPTWAGLYRAMVPLADGTEVVADEAYLTESIMDPTAKMHRGYPPLMPSYLGKLGAGDVAAIVELIKSLRAVRPEPGARTPGEAPGDARGRGLRQQTPEPEPPGGEIPTQ